MRNLVWEIERKTRSPLTQSGESHQSPRAQFHTHLQFKAYQSPQKRGWDLHLFLGGRGNSFTNGKRMTDAQAHRQTDIQAECRTRFRPDGGLTRDFLSTCLQPRTPDFQGLEDLMTRKELQSGPVEEYCNLSIQAACACQREQKTPRKS